MSASASRPLHRPERFGQLRWRARGEQRDESLHRIWVGTSAYSRAEEVLRTRLLALLSPDREELTEAPRDPAGGDLRPSPASAAVATIISGGADAASTAKEMR